MLTAATIAIILALLISIARLFTTDSAADKVIVVDIASFQLLGLVVLLAIYDDSELPLQFAFILALLGFISTLILSRLITPEDP